MTVTAASPADLGDSRGADKLLLAATLLLTMVPGGWLAGCAQLPGRPAGGAILGAEKVSAGTVDGATTLAPGTVAREAMLPLDAPLAPGSYRVLAETDGLPIAGTVVGTASVPINDAIVYFTDAADRYFALPPAGERKLPVLLALRTDAKGRFETNRLFPRGEVIFVNALLSRSRRLAGFGEAGPGQEVGVTVGSTYVLEFLRDVLTPQASFSAAWRDPSFLGAARSQAARADELIASGVLPVPDDGPDSDFVLGGGTRLGSAYVAHALASDGAAAQTWAGFISPRVVALTTFAGNFRLRGNDGGPASPSTSIGMSGPTGVTQGAPGDDAVYIAERDYHRIKRVDTTRMTMASFAGVFDGDPTVDPASLSADATPLGAALYLSRVQEIKVDKAGNLAMTFRPVAPINNVHVIGFLCRKAGQYFGRAMAADTFYRIGAPDGIEGYVDGAWNEARFRNPAGLAFDEAGNLFVADRRNNRIRRIDRVSGDVSTVVGDGWPFVTGKVVTKGAQGSPSFTLEELGGTGTASIKVTDFGRLVDQETAASGAALQASLNRPLAVAWRQSGGNEELYVYDSYNQAIRKVTIPAGGAFQNGSVTTVIGKKRMYTHAAGYSVPVGEAGGVSEGPASAAALNLATYDPATQGLAQVVNGGLAIDAELGRLFFVDTNNRALRMLDLDAGTVRTVAAHDPRVSEGNARRVLLSGDLGAVAVLRDHSVLLVDTENNVVRRIHLQHGF